MRNTKCTCYENYTRLKFCIFDHCENKVIANIFLVIRYLLKHLEIIVKKNLTGDF